MELAQPRVELSHGHHFSAVAGPSIGKGLSSLGVYLVLPGHPVDASSSWPTHSSTQEDRPAVRPSDREHANGQHIGLVFEDRILRNE